MNKLETSASPRTLSAGLAFPCLSPSSIPSRRANGNGGNMLDPIYNLPPERQMEIHVKEL